MKTILIIIMLLLSSGAQAGEYTVQPYDTLCKIAAAYQGLTAKTLYRANRRIIDKRNQKLFGAKKFWVYTGQKLQIPSEYAAKKAVPSKTAFGKEQIKRDMNGVGQWKVAGGNAFGQRNPIQALEQLPEPFFTDQDRQLLIKAYGQPAEPITVKPGQLFDWALFGNYRWQDKVRWSGLKNLEAEIWPEARLGNRNCRLLRVRVCNNFEIICQAVPATEPVIAAPETTSPLPAEKKAAPSPPASPAPLAPSAGAASQREAFPFPPVPIFAAASSARQVNVRPPKELPKTGNAAIPSISNYEGGDDLKIVGIGEGTLNLLIPVSAVQEFYSNKNLVWSINVSMARADNQRWKSINNNEFSVFVQKKENGYLLVSIKLPTNSESDWFWIRLTGRNNGTRGEDLRRLWINLGSAYARLDSKGYPAYELLIDTKNRTFLAVPPIPALP